MLWGDQNVQCDEQIHALHTHIIKYCQNPKIASDDFELTGPVVQITF